MSVTLNGIVYDAASFKGYGYSDLFPSPFVDNMLAEVQNRISTLAISGTIMSASSHTVSTGAKTFAAGTGLGFYAGQTLRIYAATAPGNYMYGAVTSYDPATGWLVMNIIAVTGSGTYTAWLISNAGYQYTASPTPGINQIPVIDGSSQLYLNGKTISLGTNTYNSGTAGQFRGIGLYEDVNDRYGFGIHAAGGLEICANQAGQGIKFFAGTNNTAPSLRMFITGSGNILMGTSVDNGVNKLQIVGSVNIGQGYETPSGALSVCGAGQTAFADSNAGATLKIIDQNNGANAGGAIAFGGHTSTHFAGIKGLLQNGTGNSQGDLAFYTRAATADTALTERLRLIAAGRILIGTTTDDGVNKLQINAADGAGIKILNTAESSTVLRLYTAGASLSSRRGKIQAYRETVGAIALTLQEDGGNVLIGTTTDDASNRLQICGPGFTAFGNVQANNKLYFTDRSDADTGAIVNIWRGSQNAAFLACSDKYSGANNVLFQVKGAGDVILGYQALATTATVGFLWLPSCAGTPTGAPTAPYTNAAAVIVDTTGSKLWVRVGTTWKSATLT